MKKYLQVTGISLAVITIVGMITLAGCTTSNPTAGQPIVDPTTGFTNGFQPPTIVSPALNNISNQLAGIATALAPINPYAGLTDMGLKFVFGLITAVSAGVALSKNNAAAKATGTLNQIATSVVAQGPAVAQAVIDHSSNNSVHAAAVFTAINSLLPPDKTTPPTA